MAPVLLSPEADKFAAVVGAASVTIFSYESTRAAIVGVPLKDPVSASVKPVPEVFFEYV